MGEIRGSMVVVWRNGTSGREFLVLRATGHADQEDWAWRPPGGCAEPGEPDDVCAARELQEETGLALPLRPAPDATGWPTFLAKAEADSQVQLSAEHEAFAWLPLHELLELCRPAQVAEDVARAARLLAR